MELGEKLKQARLDAGLSQRQLCGDTITRNMLSLIENGSARPSMDTLTVLASRLGKPVSFFLGEDEVKSSKEQRLELHLEQLEQARRAVAEGKLLYGTELLDRMEIQEEDYCGPDLQRQKRHHLRSVLAITNVEQAPIIRAFIEDQKHAHKGTKGLLMLPISKLITIAVNKENSDGEKQNRQKMRKGKVFKFNGIALSEEIAEKIQHGSPSQRP